MTKPATIRDVARAAGVSVAAVSRVLNEGSGPVSSGTRQKVVEAIDALAYVPRQAARELKGESSRSLGLVLADVTNPFFARLADSVVSEGRTRGVQVVLMTTREDARLEMECINAMVERGVGGVIATPTSSNAEGWARLRGRGVPVVFVDRSVPELPAATVTIENRRAALAATEHLIALGHRRIGLVSGPEQATTATSRVDGYREALESAGLPVDERLIFRVPFRGDHGSDAVGAMLAMPDRPTAIVVANTAQVVSALERLIAADVDVPGDLSVVVFDDNPWTRLFRPALTVVTQPIPMLAAHSVDLALAAGDGAAGRTVTVEAELLVRQSTAPPPGRAQAPSAPASRLRHGVP